MLAKRVPNGCDSVLIFNKFRSVLCQRLVIDLSFTFELNPPFSAFLIDLMGISLIQFDLHATEPVL